MDEIHARVRQLMHLLITTSRLDIKNATLLIIDEISMVSANLLDGISGFLRSNRPGDKPFGGLPIVMVGDLFQLPPVVERNIKQLFYREYGGHVKFYAAKCLTETGIIYYGIELKTTFRQSDKSFVDVLADIREGRNLPNALQILNSRCEIIKEPPDGAVWLAPRRVQVDTVNQIKLKSITGIERCFEGTVEGIFKKTGENLPSPMMLQLKEGAQVMFTQNDPKRRWINGTVGIVEKLTDNIVVRCLPSNRLVDVDLAKWDEFRYFWDRSSQKIKRGYALDSPGHYI